MKKIILITFFVLLAAVSLFVSCYSDIDFIPTEVPKDTPTNPSNPSNPSNPNPPKPAEPVEPEYSDNTYFIFSKNGDNKRPFTITIMGLPENVSTAEITLIPKEGSSTSKTILSKEIQFKKAIPSGSSFYTIESDSDDIELGTYSIKVTLDGNSDVPSFEAFTNIKNKISGTTGYIELQEPEYIFELGKTMQVAYKEDIDNNDYSVLIGNAPYANKVTVTPITQEEFENNSIKISKSSLNSLIKNSNDLSPIDFEIDPQTGKIDMDSSYLKKLKLDENHQFLKFHYDKYYPDVYIDVSKPVMHVEAIENESKWNSEHVYGVNVYNLKPNESVKLKLLKGDSGSNSYDYDNKIATIDNETKTTSEIGTVSFTVTLDEVYFENFAEGKSGIQNFYFDLDYVNPNAEDKKPDNELISIKFIEPTPQVLSDDSHKKEFNYIIFNAPKGFEKVKISAYKLNINESLGNIKDIIEKGSRNPQFVFESDIDKEYDDMPYTQITDSFTSTYPNLNQHLSGNLDWGRYVFRYEYYSSKLEGYVYRGTQYSSLVTIKELKPFDVEISQFSFPDKVGKGWSADGSLTINVNNALTNNMNSVEMMMRVKPFALSSTESSNLINIALRKITKETGDGVELKIEYYFAHDSVGVNKTVTDTLVYDPSEGIAKGTKDELNAKYNLETDTFTFKLPNNQFGKFIFNITARYSGSNEALVFDREVGIVSNEYNIAVLEGTNAPTVFAEFFLMDPNYQNIPTIITLENGDTYDWDYLSTFDIDDREAFTNFIMKNPKTNMYDFSRDDWSDKDKNRLEINRVRLMSDYVKDLIDLSKKTYEKSNIETKFNFFFSDISPELALGIVFANGFENINNQSISDYEIHYLSNGSDTSQYIKRVYEPIGNGVTTSQDALSAMNADWNKYIQLAKGVGEYANNSNYSEEDYWNEYTDLVDLLKGDKSLWSILNLGTVSDTYNPQNDSNYPCLSLHMLSAFKENNTYWHVGREDLLTNEIKNNLDISFNNKDYLVSANVVEGFNNQKYKSLISDYEALDTFLKIFGLDYSKIISPLIGGNGGNEFARIPVLFVGKEKDYGFPDTNEKAYLKEYLQIAQILYPYVNTDNKDLPSYCHYYVGDYSDFTENYNKEPETALLAELNTYKGSNWTLLDSKIQPGVYAGILIYQLYDPTTKELLRLTSETPELKLIGYQEQIFRLIGDSNENANVDCSFVSTYDQINDNFNLTLKGRLRYLATDFDGKLFSVIMPYGYKIEESKNNKGINSDLNNVTSININKKLDINGDEINSKDIYFSAYFISNIDNGAITQNKFTEKSYERNEEFKKDDISTHLKMFGEIENDFANPNEFNRIEFKSNANHVIDQNDSSSIVFYNRVLKSNSGNDAAGYSDIKFEYDFGTTPSTNLGSKLLYRSISKTPSSSMVAFLERDLDYIQYGDEQLKVSPYGAASGENGKPKPSNYPSYLFHKFRAIQAKGKFQRDNNLLVQGIGIDKNNPVIYLASTGGTGEADYNIFSTGRITDGRLLIIDFTGASYFYTDQGSSRCPTYYEDRYIDGFDPTNFNSGDLYKGNHVRLFGCIDNNKTQINPGEFLMYEKSVQCKWGFDGFIDKKEIYFNNDSTLTYDGTDLYNVKGELLESKTKREYGQYRHQYNIMRDGGVQLWYYDMNNNGIYDISDKVLNEVYKITPSSENYGNVFIDFYEVPKNDISDHNSISFDIGVSRNKGYQARLEVRSVFNTKVKNPNDINHDETKEITVPGGEYYSDKYKVSDGRTPNILLFDTSKDNPEDSNEIWIDVKKDSHTQVSGETVDRSTDVGSPKQLNNLRIISEDKQQEAIALTNAKTNGEFFTEFKGIDLYQIAINLKNLNKDKILSSDWVKQSEEAMVDNLEAISKNSDIHIYYEEAMIEIEILSQSFVSNKVSGGFTFLDPNDNRITFKSSDGNNINYSDRYYLTISGLSGEKSTNEAVVEIVDGLVSIKTLFK